MRLPTVGPPAAALLPDAAILPLEMVLQEIMAAVGERRFLLQYLSSVKDMRSLLGSM